LMSVLGAEKLVDALSRLSDTSDILQYLNKSIKLSLRQSGDGISTSDGMEIALCSVSFKEKILRYAGANRPMWFIPRGKNVVIEYEPTRRPIGGHTDEDQHFHSHEIRYKKGDSFYIFSDGYADTFSGIDGKKLKSKKFREILLQIRDIPMQEQGKHLDDFIEEWKKSTGQVDDILVIGVCL
jgi:serine phosphatase RsbU (regulator of sigma subunit)